MQFQPIQTVQLYRVSQSKKNVADGAFHSNSQQHPVRSLPVPQVITGTPFPVSRAAPLWGDKGSNFCEYSASTWQRHSKKFHYVTGWNNLYMSWFGEMCKCGRSSLNLKIINGSFFHSTQTSCSALVSRRLEQAPVRLLGGRTDGDN